VSHVDPFVPVWIGLLLLLLLVGAMELSRVWTVHQLLGAGIGQIEEGPGGRVLRLPVVVLPMQPTPEIRASK
jgi:hypothetical protein